MLFYIPYIFIVRLSFNLYYQSPNIQAKEIQAEKRVDIRCPESNNTEESFTTTVGPWIESEVIAGLRVWQLSFLIIIGLLIVVIALCCFMKCRLPRTKEEIEENHRRNKIVKKFRKHLRKLKVEEEMDLISALHCVQKQIHQDTTSTSSTFWTDETEKTLFQEKYEKRDKHILEDKLHQENIDSVVLNNI